MKKKLCACFSMTMVIAALILSGCKDAAGDGGDGRIPLTSIEITPDSKSLTVGGIFTPSFVISPGNTTDAIEWSSEDTSKVIVNKNNGRIFAEDVTDFPVKVFLKSKQNPNQYGFIFITVLDEEKHLVDLSVVPESQSLVVGRQFTPMLVKSPPDSTDTVEWSSQEETKVSVNKDTGEITAVAVSGGTVKVTARSKENPDVYAECIITVVSGIKPLISLDFESESVTLDIGERYTPAVSRSPDDTTDTLEWSSADPNKVSVNKDTGEITAKEAAGNPVTITVKSVQTPGVSASFDVTVAPLPNIPVTGVTISGWGNFSKIGSSFSPPARTLSANVHPSNATDKSVQWTSGDTGVAIVSFNGVVTPMGIGSTTITVTTNDQSETDTVTITITEVAPGSLGAVTITEAEGWLETLYVTWEKMPAAESYRVEYQKADASAWTSIDDPLIREYGDYYRADIPGLAAGGYTVRVTPFNSIEEGIPSETSVVTVEAHDRSGFAFVNDRVPGGYNADGTPKTGARIIYVTEATKDKVQVRMKLEKAEEERTGLYNILKAYEKGYEDRPLIIRFIGRVNEKKGSSNGVAGDFTDNEGTAMIKGKSGGPAMNLTLEGIGDDAAAYGWGIRTNTANAVEIRNLGFILANTEQKDAIGLEKSTYIWVHNCDFFYMQAGGDSDQKKGDGSLDVKICDYVTLSYNHFWDSGKSSLLGNGTETPGRLTYHHNWFDHSDSRHPRVRRHTTHVYNNYYDGIGKYGIGATIGASIFAEANYFRNTKKPMMISKQGTDIAGGGTGSFSGNDGGIIKAYNNYMDSVTSAGSNYRPWSGSNTVEFDAYGVTNRNDTVPETVKTKQGGRLYNNFDTDASMYSYTPDSPEDAKTNVMKYAGRYWGGDLRYNFNNTTDDAKVEEPMPELLALLQNYTSKLVSVQGGGIVSGGDGGGTEPPPPIEGSVICSFGMSGSSGSSVFVNNSAFTIVTGNGTKSGKTISGTSYDVALKLESSTVLTFSTGEPMTLIAYATGGINLDGTDIAASGDTVTASIAAGSHTIKRHSKNSGNLWLIVLMDL